VKADGRSPQNLRSRFPHSPISISPDETDGGGLFGDAASGYIYISRIHIRTLFPLEVMIKGPVGAERLGWQRREYHVHGGN
jgi:hypothetical protein